MKELQSNIKGEVTANTSLRSEKVVCLSWKLVKPISLRKSLKFTGPDIILTPQRPGQYKFIGLLDPQSIHDRITIFALRSHGYGSDQAVPAAR
ncbi:MAG: hypothetical protein KUG76_07370 [Gammaproteobacteria bacterium]|nr:hypothetical protein [Gammaproteobacteria bacterium]